MIQFTWSAFYKLSLDQLYAILALRSDVFVVEQRCFYLDPDGNDRTAVHLMGQEDNSLVAYARLFPPTDEKNYLVFGRVLTSNTVRGKGYGKKLITELLQYCDTHFKGIPIKASAQLYLQKFYEEFGFVTKGNPYDDAGVPHIEMVKQA
jgi:ElaA protein